MKSQDSFNEIKDSFEPETEIQNEILNLEKDVEKAEEMNSEVELIYTETEEGMQLLRAFGGVAAILRYHVG